MSPAPEDLVQRLSARMGRETVVVGVGNPSRGDDAAGCMVARFLREAESERGTLGLRIVEAEEVPESFLGPIVQPPPDTVVLVDAVELGEPPGAVAILEVEDLVGREPSTHRAPLSLVAHYIREETGGDVFVLGIQPGGRQPGAEPSPEVSESACILAQVLETAAILAEGPGAVPDFELWALDPCVGPSPASRVDAPEVPC